MCGIVGIISKGQTVTDEHVAAMRQTIAHRGPDGEGVYISDDNRIGLGHRRLSLVELNDKGAQPMHKYGYTIVFNGEVYNYRELARTLKAEGYELASHSDTEIILTAYHAWGIDCIKRFNGAFAFILVDSRTNTTFVVRDRIGEKPLYYTETADTWLFASEIKAFKGMPGVIFKPDLDTIRLNLIFHFFADKEATYFSGIRSVRPGHYLTFRDNKITDHQYWDVAVGDGQPYAHPEKQIARDVDEIAALLDDAVSMRLSADAPVGSLLSGGLDSSILTTIAAGKTTGALHSFNLYMEGQEDEDAASAQRLAAAVPNITLHRTPIDNALFNQEALDDAAWHLEEIPLRKSLYLRKNYRAVRDAGLKAVLNGQGSDEISLGYYNFYDFLQHEPADLEMTPFAEHWFTTCAFKQYMPEADMRRLIDTNLHTNYLPYMQQDDTVNSVLAFGVKTHLLNILNHEDRFSMAASIECRTAFTDYRVIEKFMQIPARYKVYDGREKYLVRVLGDRLLPPGITDRKKTSFPPFAGDQEKQMVDAILADAGISKSPLLNQLFSEQLFTDLPAFSQSMRWKVAALYRFEQVFFA
jgi:asparagine synthase (glutamine-hydrolysing)